MKLIYKFFSLFFLGLILSCSTADVMADYDRSFDYKSVKTFQFSDEKINEDEAIQTVNLMNAISSELNAMGLQQTYTLPDVIVSLKPSSKVFESEDARVGIGTGSYGRGISGGIQVGIPIKSKKVEKQWVLEMNDAQTGNLIYQAIYSDVQKLKKNSDKKNENKIAESLFKDYPTNSN